MDGGISKLRKRCADPRFCSIEDATIAFQRFSQRANARLLDGLPLAAGTSSQSLLKEEPVVVHVGEIVIGCDGGSEASPPTMSSSGALARHQRAHDAGDRTQLTLELLKHLPLVEGAMPSVRCMDLWASSQAHRPGAVDLLRRSARRTLGTAGELVVSSLQREDAGRHHRVEEGTFPCSSDPTGDFRYCFRESCVLRRCNGCRDPTQWSVRARAPCDVLFEFAVAPQPLRETLPTRRPPRHKHWPYPRLDPDGLHQKPSLAGGE